MKKVIQLPAIANEGRFGNKLIHYIVGKCYAESVGATVEIPRGWIGETVFEISEPYIHRKARMLAPKLDRDFDGAVALPPFFNLPHRIVDPCLTRETVKRLLKWRVVAPLVWKAEAVIHVRRGDFLTNPDFPLVQVDDLVDAARKWIPRDEITFVNEALSRFGFLEDFKTIMFSKNIFVYPRSTFGQMAALLGDGSIYMPYEYGSGPTTCKFRLADPSKPVTFPTKNNNLP